jgi:hypothetical protein
MIGLSGSLAVYATCRNEIDDYFSGADNEIPSDSYDEDELTQN